MIEYPSLERIAALFPGPQILLGRRIWWTEKRDGSQWRVALKDGELQVATRNRVHNQEAGGQFCGYYAATKEAAVVEAMLRNAEAVPGVTDLQEIDTVFGELLVKGRSPARFEIHEQHEFVVFDVATKPDGKFMPYLRLYQLCYQWHLPVVACWGESQHTTTESLCEFRDEMLARAKRDSREGVVLKTYGNPDIFAKEKVDLPVVPIRHIEQGQVILGPLPESELYGAIAKVHADLGDAFRDKTQAMPLVAKAVQLECEKHMCGRPVQKLFEAYLRYLEGLSAIA